VETPEAPREGNAARLGKSAEGYGLAGASWVGRGDEERGLTLLALVLGAAYFGLGVGGFVPFQYGAWLGLVIAILLIVVAALRLATLRRSAP
jgi:hypothetical protein